MTDSSYQPPSVDAARSFNTALGQLGLSLDDDNARTAAAAFAQALRIDRTTGRAFVVDTNGAPMLKVENGQAIDLPALDLVRELAERHGAKTRTATAPAAPAPGQPSPNLTEKMRQTRANESKAISDAITGNPWRKGNLTEQMLVSRHDPARAARLKAEAGR